MAKCIRLVEFVPSKIPDKARDLNADPATVAKELKGANGWNSDDETHLNLVECELEDELANWIDQEETILALGLYGGTNQEVRGHQKKHKCNRPRTEKLGEEPDIPPTLSR